MVQMASRELFGFVHRAGTERSGARVLAELSRFIGNRLSVHRVTVYALDGEHLVPLVSEYSSGTTDVRQFARWRGAMSLATTEMADDLRGSERPILVRNPRDALPRRLVKALGIQPFLVVALRADTEFIGALIVEGDPDSLIAQEDSIETHAGVVALALEAVKTFRIGRERIRGTNALLEVGAVLARSTYLIEVLASVARNSARVCDFERCSILILDEAGTLKPVMSQFADGHTDMEMWDMFCSIEADLPAARQVLDSGKPAAYSDPENNADLNPALWIRPFGSKSILFVPLTAWDERFGVLMLDHQERRSISPAQISATQVVADQGAAAIGVSRLLEREAASRHRAVTALADLSAREAQQAAVAAVSQVAVTGSDLGELMSEVVRVLTKTLDVEYAKVLELLPDGRKMLLRAGVGWDVGLVGTATVESGISSQAGFTLASSGPVIVENLDTEQRFRGPELLVNHRVVSGVSVIIGGREKPYGVLGIHTVRQCVFTAEDVNFVQSLANVLAGAIERDRGDKAIIDSEGRLQTILNTASDAIISVDEKQTITLFNECARQIFGYSSDEALGQPLNMLLPIRSRQVHGEDVRRFAGGEQDSRGMAERSTLLGRRKNGEEFPVEITISKARLGDQLIFTAIVRDVTAVHATRLLMRKTEERYKNLFERSPIAIWEQDFSAVGAWLDGLRDAGVIDLGVYLAAHPKEAEVGMMLVRTLSVNPAGLDLIGARSLEEILETAPEEAHDAGIRQSFIVQFLAIWDQVDRVEFEFTATDPSSDRIDCALHFAAGRTGGRLDLDSVIVALVNITERKVAEALLRDSVRSKEELIASVSHEIRTPLTAILGFAELLSNDASGFTKEEHAEMLRVLVSESIDVANIVEDLLVAAKSDTGNLQVMRVPVDLRAQAAQVLEAWDQSVTGHIRLVGGQVRCVGDPARVRQIVRNLISNALRYGGDHIRIEVGRHESAGYIVLVDDGPGVLPQDVDRVFEFYRSGEQVPGLTVAMGLGLGISRRLARIMDGDVTYRRSDGETVFELALPLAVSVDVGVNATDSADPNYSLRSTRSDA